MSDVDLGLPLILRCCRDWPCHYEYLFYPGRCGQCREVPIVVWENYEH